MRHDLTSLKLFVVVAECGNLTRAAEREHLAVSAVSKRITDLEEQIGSVLLQRHARGVSLTPAGHSLLQHARQILQMLQRMDADMGEYAQGVKGNIRLHAVASALMQFLPEEIETFLDKHPLVNIGLVEQTGPMVVQSVLDGGADLGIVVGQTPVSGVSLFPYRRDRLVLGVPLGHPLAGRKSVRFHELAEFPFIGPHAGSSLAVLLAAAEKSGNITLKQRVQASSFDAMCRLVEIRLGLTILPDGVLAPYVKTGRLGMVTLKEAWAVRQLHLVVRNPEQLNPVAGVLLAHLGISMESS
ncbi:MAG: LysR substrate-binding domain-containing protein [Neisseria sp.]|nr:LysR substrate-binding domain-containing protein [Neisseria sp.]